MIRYQLIPIYVSLSILGLTNSAVATTFFSVSTTGRILDSERAPIKNAKVEVFFPLPGGLLQKLEDNTNRRGEFEASITSISDFNIIASQEARAKIFDQEFTTSISVENSFDPLGRPSGKIYRGNFGTLNLPLLESERPDVIAQLPPQGNVRSDFTVEIEEGNLAGNQYNGFFSWDTSEPLIRVTPDIALIPAFDFEFLYDGFIIDENSPSVSSPPGPSAVYRRDANNFVFSGLNWGDSVPSGGGTIQLLESSFSSNLIFGAETDRRTQTGIITYSDPSRVPEPTTTLGLLAIGFITIKARRGIVNLTN